MTAARALFVAGTTYHVFLACGLAANQPAGTRRHLIVHADFEDCDVLTTAIARMASPLFEDVTILPRSEGLPDPLWRLRVIQNNLRTSWAAHRQQYDWIYIFNEYRPVHQAAVYWGKRRHRGAVAYATEDGASDYKSQPLFERLSLADRTFRALFYGWWYRNVRWRGTSPWVDRHLLTHADLVTDPPHDRPVEQLPLSPFQGAAMRMLATAYLAERGLSKVDVAGLDGVVFLTRSERVADPPAYGAVLRDLIDRAAAERVSLAVKYHPGEKRRDPFGFADDGSVVTLPGGLASEFLFVHPACRLRYVVGDLSTTLLTCRWLRPETAAISVAPIVGRDDPQLLETFGKLGIPIAQRPDDLPPLLTRQ